MHDTERLTWKTLARKTVFQGPIFNVGTVQRESTDGRIGDFIEIDAPLWATVIPWYRDAGGTPCFLMVCQYRHGSGSVTIEFPAGTVDSGETPEHAARRELLEETGCQSDREIVLLGSVNPNPAFMNNRVSFYFAEGLIRTGSQQLDPNEQLDILCVPVKEVLENMGTGVYDSGIMMIAQAFFLRYAQQRPGLLS